jgi:YCII-related domain
VASVTLAAAAAGRQCVGDLIAPGNFDVEPAGGLVEGDVENDLGVGRGVEVGETAGPRQCRWWRRRRRRRRRDVQLRLEPGVGKTLTTDGPFVEIKESIGGYLLFEADDLDSAIELASQIPAARMGGTIEVRPIVEW